MDTKNTTETNAEKAKDVKLVSAEPVKKKKRFNLSIIPNSCTSMNLVCGFLSIIMTSRGEFIAAAWLILVANIFDILDGRLARMASVESQFGAELDSLCDLVSFGVAPSFLIYTRYLEPDKIFSLFVACLFVVCGALRLARFNVTPPHSTPGFEGLPIPGGAGILATLTIYEMQYGLFNPIRIPSDVIPFIVVITSLLMVSKIEYPAIKKTPKTTHKRIVAVMFVVAAFFAFPQIALFIITWGFALFGLLRYIFRSIKRLFRSKKDPEKIAVD